MCLNVILNILILKKKLISIIHFHREVLMNITGIFNICLKKSKDFNNTGKIYHFIV